jgi:hypothetical protein
MDVSRMQMMRKRGFALTLENILYIAAGVLILFFLMWALKEKLGAILG